MTSRNVGRVLQCYRLQVTQLEASLLSRERPALRQAVSSPRFYSTGKDTDHQSAPGNHHPSTSSSNDSRNWRQWIEGRLDSISSSSSADTHLEALKEALVAKDPSALTVPKLKSTLTALGLSINGKKFDLIHRLQQYMDSHPTSDHHQSPSSSSTSTLSLLQMIRPSKLSNKEISHLFEYGVLPDTTSSMSSSTTAAIKRRSDFWRPDLKKVDIEEFDARAISLLPPPREVAVNLMNREAAAAATAGQEISGSRSSQQQQQQQQRRGGRGGSIIDTDMRIHPEKKFIPRDTYVPADLNPYQRVFMTIDDEKDESARRSPATKWREHAALVLKNARRIDFRQYEDLDKFLTASGQLPRREWTGLRTKVQKHVCRQVKIARQMALLPTTQTLAGKRESDQWERYLDEQEMIQNSKRGGSGSRRGGGGDGGYAQLSAAEQAEQHDLLLEQAGRKGGKRGRAGAGTVKLWDVQFSELTEFLKVHNRLPSDEQGGGGDEKEKELAIFLKRQQASTGTVDPSRKAMVDILLLSLHGGDDDLNDEVVVDDKPKKK